ncbi:MAG: 4a-hydroxytetrahydrobiopterin dehydratase [Alphaproteobacteria bacterium]
MLIAVDPSLETEAAACVEALAVAYKEPVSAFVAPAQAPEPGLAAALAASPPLVVEGPNPPAWLGALPAKRVRATRPLEPAALVEAVASAAGLTAKAAPKPHAEQVAPLDGDALAAGLAPLPTRWRLEVVPARAQPQGLKVELVADFRCPSYGEAADFARLVATIADEQDHHPTLIHDWRSVQVRITTGAAKGRLSERDLRFAQAVDARFGA